MIKITCPLLVFSLLAPSVHADEPGAVITDRPDQTESTNVLPLGYVQLEIGVGLLGDDEAGAKTEVLEVPTTLVRIGLARRAELRIGWDGLQDLEIRGGASPLRDDGAGDTSLGVKIALGGDPTSIESALLLETSLPTGSEGFGSDRADPALRYIGAHDLTDNVGLGFNVGVAWETERIDDDPSTRSAAFYTFATGFGLTEKLGAFAEVFGRFGLSDEAHDAHSFDGGLTYLLRPNLQLDLAGGVGLNDEADDWFVGVGVSARLPR